MKFLLLCFSVLFCSCSSLNYQNNQAHRLYDSGRCEEAALSFRKAGQSSRANKLLYKLDEGSSLLCAQKYKEAKDVFLEAEKLAEFKDYTSLSEEGAALAVSDQVRSYVGEPFERVLINVYLALIFASLGELDAALVEARKINHILNRMILDGNLPYEEMPFARFLSGLLWESAGDWNDAYIAYKKTYELDPNFPDIGESLIRAASKMGFRDELRKWKKVFPKNKKNYLKKNEGELIIFFQKGKSPVKVSRGTYNNSLPRYQNRFYHNLKMRLKGTQIDPKEQFVVLNIAQLSRQYLDAKIDKIAAKKLLRTATKGAAAIALGSATKSSELGWLAFYALMALDQEDLRSWQSLPAEILMLRHRLVEGKYNFQLELLLPDDSVYRVVEFPESHQFIRAGKRTILFLR